MFQKRVILSLRALLWYIFVMDMSLSSGATPTKHEFRENTLITEAQNLSDIRISKAEDDDDSKAVDCQPGYTVLKRKDFENSNHVDVDHVEFNISAMYADDKFEGDMVFKKDKNGQTRSMVRYENRLWPGRKVPYLISDGFGESDRAVIARAMNSIQQRTCVRFVPKKFNHYAYLSIESFHEGCWSYVGYSGQKQPVSLGRGCLGVGIVQHELMHALGFYHEQSRYDRDSFIRIKWPNIMHGMESQFQRATRNEMDFRGFRYDMKSVMHYDSYAFSKNRYPTMLTKSGQVLHPAKIATENDYRKINKLYKCY